MPKTHLFRLVETFLPTKKKSKKIALKLLAHNFPLDEIADLTDLSIDEIKKLEQ